MDRVILHCDCNSFFASVECVLNPKLKKLPMAVCGDDQNRHGIILAKNELAKKYGVKTAETIFQATEKCPNLVLTKSHHSAYLDFSRRVNEIYLKYTDYVEPFGIDESWLDVTNTQKVFGSGYEIADKIRREIKEKIGITVSVGVSFNKVFAKLGSDYKKPDAITIINKENFKNIVFPLEVSSLMYVGRHCADELRDLGIQTIGELANFRQDILQERLGKMGVLLHDYANGIDDTPVVKWGEQEDIKSVGNGMTFKRDLMEEEDIKTAVTSLSDTVSERMRRYGVKCTTISVQLKSSDFKVFSKQSAFKIPINTSGQIKLKSLELIKEIWESGTPIRSITITGTGLTNSEEQLQVSFFSEENASLKHTDINNAMDTIRSKYGHGAIKHASLIKNNIGISHKDKHNSEGKS